MFRVVKFGRYVIVHAICDVSLNIGIKRKKKRITLRAWAACVLAYIIRDQIHADAKSGVSVDATPLATASDATPRLENKVWFENIS